LLRLEKYLRLFATFDTSLQEQLRHKMRNFKRFRELGYSSVGLLSPDFPGWIHVVKVNELAPNAFR
jgi:hypothetical protein